MQFTLEYEAREDCVNRTIGVNIQVSDSFGTKISTLQSRNRDTDFPIHLKGTIICKVPYLPLAPGRYRLKIRCLIGANAEGIPAQAGDSVEDAGILNVDESDFYKTGKSINPRKHGRVLIWHEWKESESINR